MAQITTLDEWVTVPKAALLLGYRRETIYGWIRDKKIANKDIATLPNGRLIVRVKAIVKPKPKRPKGYIKHNIRPGEMINGR